MTNIAILASGTGSNANEIAKYFANHDSIQVAIIITNNPQAGVLKVAETHHIPSFVISDKEMKQGGLLKTLQVLKIDFVVLAGFLKLIPADVIDAYPRRIINLHPALLPQFGGKGMYGKHVHEAVSASGQSETGITIHYVNENYDEGSIIAQYKTAIHPHENPEDIQQKVRELEHEHYPAVIEQVVKEAMVKPNS